METRPHRSSSPPITTTSLERERTQNKDRRTLFAGDILRSLPAWSRANLIARHGHLKPCPAEFGQSPGMEIPHSLRAPVPVLHHPWGKHFFLLSNQNFPGCSLASCLRSSSWATLRRLWLYLLSRSTSGSGKLQLGCPLSLLQAEQTWSFQPLLIHHVLGTPDHFICSPVDLLQFVNTYFVLRDKNWTRYSRCVLINDKWRRKIVPQSAGCTCINAAL